MQQTILIAEDEADIRNILRMYLESEGYRVIEAPDGKYAMTLTETQRPDLAILDIMMPEFDGFLVTKWLRERFDLPILILSARSQDNDKILGLNLGADDYIAKPFNPLEIVARVRALLRRSAPKQEAVLRVRDLELHTDTMLLIKRGAAIALTLMEYRILAQLMREPGRIFTKAQLYTGASGTLFESDDNTMMVHISNLRDKIEDNPKNPGYIITVRGLGYKIER